MLKEFGKNHLLIETLKIMFFGFLKSDKMIEWVNIKGFENLYKISNTGNVFSVKRIVWNGFGFHILKSKILKQQIAGKGYLKVSLRKNKKTYQRYIHRLVGENFIKKLKGKNQINHKDGIKTNNDVTNLEWCTSKENLKHAKDIGLNKNFGDTHYKRKGIMNV